MVINLVILITFTLDDLLMLLGENSCWSLLGIMFKATDEYCLFQVIDKALTVLKTLPPNMTVIPQQSPMQIDHTVFYRKQAWLVVQVMIIETLRFHYLHKIGCKFTTLLFLKSFIAISLFQAFRLWS